MSNIDKHALREAAENAQTARARLESMSDEDVVLFEENDIKSDVSICNKFIVTANPATVLALLDELKESQALVANESACADSTINLAINWQMRCKDAEAKLEAAEKRIAECEQRELARKRQLVINGLCDSGEACWEIEEYMKRWDAEHPREAAAAGIGVKGE